MGSLTRIGILTCLDRRREPHEVPEWGGTVFVQSLSGRERIDFSLSLTVEGTTRPDPSKIPGLQVRLLLMALVDENGARLFGPEDEAELGGKNAAVLDRLFAVAQRLSGLAPGSAAAAAARLGETQSSGAGTA